MASRWIAGTAALALAAALATPGMAQEPIRIGALYNLTGGMASIDGPSLSGAKLAANQINEAGGLLDGRQIEVIAIDTKTDQQETAKAAQRLLSEDVVAAIGFTCLAQGYRLAPATAVAPFEYASLPWAVLWGWTFWSEIPSATLLVGIVLVVGSGLYVFRREAVRARERAR